MPARRDERAAKVIDRLCFAITALVPYALQGHSNNQCCSPQNPCMLREALVESTNRILKDAGEVLNELQRAPRQRAASLGITASRAKK